VWIFDGVVDDGDTARTPAPSRRRSDARTGPGAPDVRGGGRRSGDELPDEVTAEVAGAAGRRRASRVNERLAAAAAAYGRDRYSDALRITKPLVGEIPDSASARELHGLVCYRLGRWREAITHLEASSELAGEDPNQLPVVMDCHRALGHHRRVREVWDRLRAASPSADVLAEGRLVMAATLADRDELAAAIDLLVESGAGRDLRHPHERHIRQWYLLADLSERVGDLPRARELFARVARADPELADAAERAAALGRPAPRRGAGRGARGATVTLGELSTRGSPASGPARRRSG
jgi:tetratricopeptide (TPR) repeat protein